MMRERFSRMIVDTISIQYVMGTLVHKVEYC